VIVGRDARMRSEVLDGGLAVTQPIGAQSRLEAHQTKTSHRILARQANTA
jgi:hypothetical protein